jgi:histone deacetylase 1/2
MTGRNVVSYFYDDEVGTFSYGFEHMWKPIRVKLAHNLIRAYGLTDEMIIYVC